MEDIVIANEEVAGEVGARNPLHSYAKIYHIGHRQVANPSRSDILEMMIKIYRNENRWQKAIQHLRDAGKLKGEPQDIGPLIKEFQTDLIEECAAEIKEKLFEYALPKILRGSSAGLAEYYKELLAKQQFGGQI